MKRRRTIVGPPELMGPESPSSNSAIGSWAGAGAPSHGDAAATAGGASSAVANRSSTLTLNSSKILTRFKVVLLPALYPAAAFHSHSCCFPIWTKVRVPDSVSTDLCTIGTRVLHAPPVKVNERLMRHR